MLDFFLDRASGMRIMSDGTLSEGGDDHASAPPTTTAFRHRGSALNPPSKVFCSNLLRLATRVGQFLIGPCAYHAGVQRDKDGTIKQPEYRVGVKVPLVRPMTYEVRSRKNATVDIRVSRFNALALTINVQDEKTCQELIKALEDAKMIMVQKRKKGRKVD
jgi:hypothetical protein